MPGTAATITAAVSDNIQVDHVRFEVNGTPSAPLLAPPFQQVIDVPADAEPTTIYWVKVFAGDSSGNVGWSGHVMVVDAAPDTRKPVVTLHAPSHAAPGETIHLTAHAYDDRGVAYVSFAQDGNALATDTLRPFEATFTIPTEATIGAVLGFVAEATDYSGNDAQATATVTVTALPDTTPPVVDLTVPSQAVRGEAMLLAAAATDDVGVARVEFFAGGALVATIVAPPYETTYAVPSGAPLDSSITIEARAFDFTGLQGTSTRQTRVVAGPMNGWPEADAGGP
jgi:hypothetical protein